MSQSTVDNSYNSDQTLVFMAEAIREARDGLAEGGVPIGCVIVRNGQVVARGHNRRIQRDSFQSETQRQHYSGVVNIRKSNKMLKKWMKQMALMIVSIILMVSTSDGFSLDCKYSVVKWDIGRMYTCTATVILDGETKDVTNVTDNHMEGRNNSDVKAALIYNQNLKFAPRNIQKFFKHLEAFSLFNNSIEEVTRECLNGLEQLRYFNFLYNNVEIIESNLFTTNQMIEWIDFGFNPIRHVGLNTFDNLRSLQTLNFTQTTCIDQCGVDSDSVEYLKTQLITKCQPTFEMTEMKFMN